MRGEKRWGFVLASEEMQAKGCEDRCRVDLSGKR